MGAFKNHAEKIVFAGALLGSALFVGVEMTQSEPEIFKQLSDHQIKISSALEQPKVSAGYPYSREAASKLGDYKDAAVANLQRADKAVTAPPEFVAYPRPARPKIDASSKPLEEGDLTSVETAVLGQIEKIEATGDHDGIFISYHLPQNMKNMDVIRVEVYRGDSADKIDTKAPSLIDECRPEDPTPVVEEKPAAKPAPTPAGTDRESSAEKRAKLLGEGEQPGDEAPEPEKLEVPAEFTGVRVIADRHVDPKRTYFYQLRLVGRMQIAPNSVKVVKDEQGRLVKKIVYAAPKDGTRVQPRHADPAKVFLYASELTKPVSAAALSNYQIRLSGSDQSGGKIPPFGTPDFKKRDYTGYKGIFAVRVWVKEAQEWRDITIQAGQDEKLEGTLTYKLSKEIQPKTVSFDTGYTLKELHWIEEARKIVERIPVMDANGKAVMVDGKPKYEERTRDGGKFRNEAAVLKNNTTGALEEFPKRGDFELRNKAIEWYRKLAEQSELEHKKLQERRQGIMQRNKGREEMRPREPERQNPAPRRRNADALDGSVIP